jgi:hypothetical protein
MTTSQLFINSRNGQQLVRTTLSSVIAAVFAATLAFAPDSGAQSNKPAAKKQTVAKATTARAQKVSVARKRAPLQKQVIVQDDVRFAAAPAVETAVAPQPIQAETQLVLQKAAAANTEIAVQQPVAAEQSATETAAVKAASIEPVQLEPVKADPAQTDPVEVDPANVKQAPEADPSVKAEPEGDCTVCHKRRQTLSNLPCQSLAYRRHRDHGDTDGACPPTTGSREE